MSESQSSYRQIFKATSVFGGVEVFKIIISILRSKLVAVLLGPVGMGVSGLLISNINFIASVTTFGIGTSAVKNISSANASENKNEIKEVVAVFKRIVWITGMLGTIVMILLGEWLSVLVFGNKDYKLAFTLLSVTLLINQLSAGQSVLLQALRKVQYLAKANVVGSFIGLIISIPLYYKWGVDAIVPAIIISSLTGFFLAWYYGKKIPIEKIKVERKRTLEIGKNMLQMGFILSLSQQISTGASYIISIFISQIGGVGQVGLYNAGMMIVTMYVGLVFSAMGTDYYPRLSGVAHDNKKTIQLINQQSEVAILLLSPILTVFLIFINLIVVLLYSSRFVSIEGMIHWAAFGMYFKAVSWSIAFIFLAKGVSKLFFWNELVANIYMTVLNLVGYKIAGLNGMGVSFFIGYLIYLVQVYVLAKKIFDFRFTNEFYRVFFFQVLMGVISFLIGQVLSSPWIYIVGSIIVLISVIYSFTELDKRLSLINLLKNLKSSKK
jgi:O-antigen/teichoic acid export membrane protein